MEEGCGGKVEEAEEVVEGVGHGVGGWFERGGGGKGKGGGVSRRGRKGGWGSVKDEKGRIGHLKRLSHAEPEDSKGSQTGERLTFWKIAFYETSKSHRESKNEAI